MIDQFARFGRHLPGQYLWPVLLLLGTGLGGTVALLFSSSDAQDALQQAREEQAVASAFKSQVELIRHDLRDFAKWDSAVRSIAWRLDANWITENIVGYLGGADRYGLVFVLDGQDRTVYRYGRDGTAPVDARAALGEDFGAALREVRGMSVDGNPIAGGFTLNGGRAYLYAVAAVVPQSKAIRLPPGPTPMLVIAERIDEAYLNRIEAEHNLATLRLVLRAPTEAETAVPLIGHDGRHLAWIEWAAGRPGAAVRQQILPAFAAVLILALVAAYLILRRGGRTIAALQESEARALHHANHDPLTGLPNRRALVARIRAALAEGGPLALLYMDLDGFKDANDVYGHAAGDQLLTEAAQRIRTAAPGGLVARAGGDEFAVLLPGAGAGEGAVAGIATAILEIFRRPFVIGASSVKIGISIGAVADVDGAQSGEDEIMRRADIAMYAAKADGKDCWRSYRPAMDENHHLRLRMEADLRRAVEGGEIGVLFQPVVDARGGAVVAVEALARWTHPVHGVVAPDIFIPLAEMSGLISALDRHVLMQACRAARNWDIGVAVNLSPAQFWDRNLARDIRAALVETGFPAHRLELEITENFLLRRPEAAAQVIADLRRIGVCIALDDFGTGYASIGYLRQLSFDRLKIDRGFIQGLASDPKAGEMVAAIVALARALGLEITAEGVETNEQAQAARLAGCTRLQGWLYGRPMTADAFADTWGVASGADARAN